MPRSRAGLNNNAETRFSHEDKSRPAWFADMTHLAADLFGLLAGVGQDARAGAKAQAGRAVRQLDLVTRTEFEACRAMLAKARDEQEKTNLRVSALEQAFDKAARSQKPGGAKPVGGRTPNRIRKQK